nr:PRC-barrel domain-containing protein [Allorhizocola rhizosphaerae]
MPSAEDGGEQDPGRVLLDGYGVEAADGSIGTIDEASYEVDAAYLVVDTGPWIFGRKVLLPAGTVNHIDHLERKVYVDRTKDQIKDSPEYDPGAIEGHRSDVAEYYGKTYHG